MEIIEDLLPHSKRTHGGEIIKVKNIVVHWVENPRLTSSKGIRKWFALVGKGSVRIGKKLVKLYASCHYGIGSKGDVRRLIPEDTEAYCNGGRKYTEFAKKSFAYKGKTKPNKYCISIECSHFDWSGKFSKPTQESLIRLCAHLCEKYNLEEEDVIRHYDITGKKCPKYYVRNQGEWNLLNYNIGNLIRQKS